ncbi:MAG: patatin-like phospholipase family protein [Pelovirga sp.]
MKRTLTGGLLMLILLMASAVAAADDESGKPSPAIGLALGSGGAGGLAHIAMLQVFDDLRIKPAQITGTSIGAVIGGLYAAGLSAAELRAVFEEFGGSSLDLLSQLVLSDNGLNLGDVLQLDIDNGGLIDSGGFLEFLAGKIEARSFAELKIPLAVVATDYWTGETVVLKDGDLLSAIEASMAVPGLFSPVQKDRQILIDGGTTNPLPFDLLDDGHDLVVAIDATGSRAPGEESQVSWSDALFNTFEIMQQSLIAERMRSGEPDIYIKPDTGDVRLLHFNQIDSILEGAAPAAEELKSRLTQFLCEQGRDPGDAAECDASR